MKTWVEFITYHLLHDITKNQIYELYNDKLTKCNYAYGNELKLRIAFTTKFF